MSNLLLSVMGAFAEFERELIKERQREGIALAKKRDVYKGRKKVLSDDQVSELKYLTIIFFGISGVQIKCSARRSCEVIPAVFQIRVTP